MCFNKEKKNAYLRERKKVVAWVGRRHKNLPFLKLHNMACIMHLLDIDALENS